MLVSINEIRSHLRMDILPELTSTSDVYDDFTLAENKELEGFYEAALDYCENYTGRPLVTTERPNLNASLRAALLLKIGDLYAIREGTIIGTIVARTGEIERLLHFHRVGLGV